jgi:hypothetical protein
VRPWSKLGTYKYEYFDDLIFDIYNNFAEELKCASVLSKRAIILLKKKKRKKS